ncbi:putative cell wall protein [Cardamine amara subsp. amara]|uniref:Cell wall protein n=1 Tax=Cardamine amara subsp. amara TaxID=228776 RepID=A0ABD1ANN7_CARAN
MASTLQSLTATMVLVSLLLGLAERVSGIRYIPNSSNTTKIKHSDFLVNIAPQPSVIIPGFGRFLLPPKPKMSFHSYPPLASAPITSYGIPSRFAPNPGYEAQSPSSEEEQVPPVPQP